MELSLDWGTRAIVALGLVLMAALELYMAELYVLISK
jgi:hypothetical protein